MSLLKRNSLPLGKHLDATAMQAEEDMPKVVTSDDKVSTATEDEETKLRKVMPSIEGYEQRTHKLYRPKITALPFHKVPQLVPYRGLARGSTIFQPLG